MNSKQDFTVKPSLDSEGKHCMTEMEVIFPENTPSWSRKRSGHARMTLNAHLRAGWMQVNAWEWATRKADGYTDIISSKATMLCLNREATLALRDMLNEAFPVEAKS